MTLNGIDISNWQPNIDLSQVIGDFTIIKATEGTTYVSPVADTQYQSAKSAGKLLGVYHYANSDNAEAEAQYFIDNVKGYIGEAILVLDWEGAAVKHGVAYAKTWLDYVYNQTGVHPLLYTSKSVLNAYDWSSVSKDYALWCAQYANYDRTGYQSEPWTDNNPFGSWSTPTIYQYSSRGELAGYDGNLDLDIFYGDRTAWEKLAKSDKQTEPSTPEPEPEPEPTGIKMVQYADPDGNRAYAYTHWDAINSKPEVVVKDDLSSYALKTDIPAKVSLKTGTIAVTKGLPTLNYAYNDKLVTLSFIGSVDKSIANMAGETQVGTLPNDIIMPLFDVSVALVDITSMSNMGHLKIQPDGKLIVHMASAWNGDYISGTVSYAI